MREMQQWIEDEEYVQQHTTVNINERNIKWSQPHEIAEKKLAGRMK